MAPLPRPKNTLKKNAVKKNKTHPAEKINRSQSKSSTNCEDNGFSTQTEHAKQTVHRNDTQDTSSPLSVVITCAERGILSKEESELILNSIQKQIISEANSPNPDSTSPTFDSDPLFEEGVLKMWCGNDHTLAWLKNTVSNICIPGLSLVVKSQLEIQDTSSPLSVAIICVETGILSKEESELILTAIQKQIISEAKARNRDSTCPTFNSEPLFEEGVLKLWCDNDHTLAWLKNTVSDLCIPRLSLVVKSQLEIKKRVRCRFEIPDEQRVFIESADIGRAVWYQNPWVEVIRWQLIYAEQYVNGTWFVIVGVPEDQIPTLLKAGRRLSIGLTAVYIDFEGLDGKFNSDVPGGWDPATETIVKQPTNSRRSNRRPPPIVYPFVKLTGAQVDCLREIQKNNT